MHARVQACTSPGTRHRLPRSLQRLAALLALCHEAIHVGLILPIQITLLQAGSRRKTEHAIMRLAARLPQYGAAVRTARAWQQHEEQLRAAGMQLTKYRVGKSWSELLKVVLMLPPVTSSILRQAAGQRMATSWHSQHRLLGLRSPTDPADAASCSGGPASPAHQVAGL